MLIKGMESARLKFEHAGRHLDAMNRTVDEFANGGHFKMSTRWTRTHPEYVLSAAVTDAAVIPDLIALQAADVLSNLRAALDHSVFRHVVDRRAAAGNPLSDNHLRNIQFPIIDIPGKQIRPADGFDPAVLAVLEQHQPRTVPVVADHPLWRLNKLINHDKHREALVTTSIYLEHDFTLIGDELEYVRDDGPEAPLLKPGELVSRWVFRATVPTLSRHPHELIRLEGGFHLSIDIPDTALCLPIVPTMAELRNYVGQVLDDLEAAGVL